MNEYTNLAKKTIFEYVRTGKKIEVPKNISSKLLNNKAGIFVSIHKKVKGQEKEKLRGCIGTFLPTKKNIAEEIIDNAISACSYDYRFKPISKDELDNLDISVDVLSMPEKINNLNELNPKKFGILIKAKNDSRSGLLLPDLKGIETINSQINITLQKAAISSDEKYEIYKFLVKRYK